MQSFKNHIDNMERMLGNYYGTINRILSYINNQEYRDDSILKKILRDEMYIYHTLLKTCCKNKHLLEIYNFIDQIHKKYNFKYNLHEVDEVRIIGIHFFQQQNLKVSILIMLRTEDLYIRDNKVICDLFAVIGIKSTGTEKYYNRQYFDLCDDKIEDMYINNMNMLSIYNIEELEKIIQKLNSTY